MDQSEIYRECIKALQEHVKSLQTENAALKKLLDEKDKQIVEMRETSGHAISQMVDLLKKTIGRNNSGERMCPMRNPMDITK